MAKNDLEITSGFKNPYHPTEKLRLNVTQANHGAGSYFIQLKGTGPTPIPDSAKPFAAEVKSITHALKTVGFELIMNGEAATSWRFSTVASTFACKGGDVKKLAGALRACGAIDQVGVIQLESSLNPPQERGA